MDNTIATYKGLLMYKKLITDQGDIYDFDSFGLMAGYNLLIERPYLFGADKKSASKYDIIKEGLDFYLTINGLAYKIEILKTENGKIKLKAANPQSGHRIVCEEIG